jgi:hypothetical protein
MAIEHVNTFNFEEMMDRLILYKSPVFLHFARLNCIIASITGSVLRFFARSCCPQGPRRYLNIKPERFRLIVLSSRLFLQIKTQNYLFKIAMHATRDEVDKAEIEERSLSEEALLYPESHYRSQPFTL